MNINIDVTNRSIGYQIIDAWYAYRQSTAPNYQTNIVITENSKTAQTDLNVLFAYMPQLSDTNKLDQYDLVLLCNGGEPLQVASTGMSSALYVDKVHLVTNSYLMHDHQLVNKNIWFPHNIMTCRDYWTRHFYPQFFENFSNAALSRNKGIVAINGANRVNRKYFFDALSKSGSINIVSNLQDGCSKLRQCFWESPEDTQFRHTLNEMYAGQFKSAREHTAYYSNAVTVGIDSKFGKVPPGYFIMPEYFEYSCIVFPESMWQNNELAITEKAIKCFYAGSMPFPIGGANTNKLYNAVGFATAWNLLPPELQAFDSTLDHVTRSAQIIEAIKWLNNNLDVFSSELCRQLIDQNRLTFLTCSSDLTSVKMLDKIMQV